MNVVFSQMKSPILLMFALLLGTSCYNPDTNEIISKIKTISGKWKSYKGVKYNENWRIINNNVIEGLGFSMNGTDTAFFERRKIEQIGDSLYYKVLLNKHNETIDFLLTDASNNEWKFVNYNNDYPSIIIYSIKNDSILIVTTSNIRGNKKKIFYLNRNPNE